MKKLGALLFCLFISAAVLNAEDIFGTSNNDLPQWKKSGIFSLAYNQTAVSDNWTGTEAFIRAWMARFDLSVERNGEKTNWITTFREAYGETDTTDLHAVSLDMIEFNTVWIYRIYKYLQPYASFYFLTQHNKFWDPITYIESAGFNFTLLDSPLNSLRVRTGAALRQVDSTITGNEREVGAEAVINYAFMFQNSLRFTSDFRLFDTFSDKQMIFWDNKLFLKTGPWFTTTFGYMMYFDSSRIPRHHWPDDVETMFYISLGVSFNMFN
ncbi:MAG: DUF3078 domain-containing protein [Endomicrobia bacterium]|nr:DUF3078 domain-containing protein [Endomicrobiia bacterium]MCL2507144.1 DUF3078 domain-containing protein [Endomicrobiia bacterium]